MRSRAIWILTILAMVAFAACTGAGDSADESTALAEASPRPTRSGLFTAGEESGISSPGFDGGAGAEETDPAASASDSVFEELPTSTPQVSATPAPTQTPASSPTPTITVVPTRLVERTIFDDALNPNWSLDHSQWMDVETLIALSHEGESSLSFTPNEDFSSLYFTVVEDTTQKYPRQQVLALSFWLNVGREPLPLESLAITVVGSNDSYYWVEDDNSVKNEFDPLFQETRLYFLDFNGPIPPNEWVQVELWLDDLRYDPMYEYVTGFYLKNDRGVFRTFYVDDVKLLMVERDG